MSVFDYTDFRLFLREQYAILKEERNDFTYGTIAKAAGFKSNGFVTQIFQGKTKLSDKMIPRIAEVFDLSGRERAYFKLLVHYTQAETHDDKKRYFELMMPYSEASLAKIESDQYEILDKWYYAAVRAIFSYYEFHGDYKKLGEMIRPSITAKKAEKAVDVLSRLGVIKKDDQGIFRLTQRHITTGHCESAVPINTFIVNTLDIAKDSLYRFDKPHRSLSAVSASVSKEGFDQILAEADAFRKRIIEIAKNDRNIDRVCQINMQIFPLTTIEEDGSNA